MWPTGNLRGMRSPYPREPKAKEAFPVIGGCAFGAAYAVFVFLLSFGIGFGSRPPLGHEPAFLDIPVSMLSTVFLVSVPGPVVVWWIFHRRGYSAIGAALAFIGFIVFFGLMREATEMRP